MITIPRRQCLIPCSFLTMENILLTWSMVCKIYIRRNHGRNPQTSAPLGDLFPRSRWWLLLMSLLTIYILYCRLDQNSMVLNLKLLITYNLYGLLLTVSKGNRHICTHFTNMYYTLANTVGLFNQILHGGKITYLWFTYSPFHAIRAYLINKTRSHTKICEFHKLQSTI